MRGALRPDLLNDAGWWQPRCGSTAVIYSRAAAERLGVPLGEIARRITVRHHLDHPNDGGLR